jgi:hypothetical protein
MVRLALLSLVALSLLGQQQSATYVSASGQYHQNTTFSPRDGVVRIDFRITNVANGFQFHASFASGLYLNFSGTAVQLWASRDIPGSYIEAATFLSGKTAIRGRIQRFSLRLYLELWDDDGTGYTVVERSVSPSATWNDPAYARVMVGGFLAGGDFTIPIANSNSRVDWLRIYSTAIPVRGQMPAWGGAAGDLASYEFNGNATDDSGNSKTLTATGTPTYNTSTTGAPMSIPRSGDSIFADAPLKAGESNTLGNWSVCRTNSACSSYFWTQVSGPSTLQWSSRTAASPTVTGAVATTGTDYVLRLVTTDSGGSMSTADLTVGAVAVDDNDIVIVPNATVTQLMGTVIRFGGNPWSYADYAQKDLADYFVTWINSDARFANYWDTAKAGTITVTSGSTAVTGSGTAFQTDYLCNGTDVITVWYTRPSDGSVGRHDMTVASCASQTSMTLASNYPYPTQSGRSYARGTLNQYGGWQDDGNNFYDVVRGLYVMYYRTGLSTYLTAARTMAQRFYSAPYWDQQEWATTGNFRYPRVQAHAGLWLAYHENNDNFPATFPTRMGYVAADAITRTQAYVTDPALAFDDAREVSYQVAGLQYAAKWAEPSGTRATWQGRVDYLLATTYPNSKWADGSYIVNPAYSTALTFNVTNGSASVTLQSGTIDSSYCAATYSTGTVSISGTTLTGSGTTWSGGNATAAYQIEIYGTGLTGWDATYRSYVVSVDSTTQLTLAHAYTGSNTSGLSYRLYTYNGGYNPWLFGTGQNSPDTEYYTCTYVSPTSMTLDRPYSGTTGTGAGAKGYWRYFITGKSSIPFWHSIITEAMQHVKILTTGTTSTTAAAMMVTVKDYLLTRGYFAATKGNYYGRNAVGCEPDPTRMTGCSGWNGSVGTNRDFAIEEYGPLSYVYLDTLSSADKTLMDSLYTAAYALPGYASPSEGDGSTAGVYSTSGSNTLFNAKNGKTYGQPFGVGNAPAWPAARLGGIAPLATATKSIKARLSDISGAASIVVDFLAADGTLTTSAACTSAACTISADTRQGYQYRVRYLSAGAATLATGSYAPVQ